MNDKTINYSQHRQVLQNTETRQPSGGAPCLSFAADVTNKKKRKRLCQSSLNPTNLANAASGQAAIVTATGQAINQAISTAASTALKAATN